MPIIHGQVADDGCLITIRIGLSRTETRARRSAGRAIPMPIEILALVDPGAQLTAVDPKLLTPFGLPYSQVVLINAPSLGGLSGTVQLDAGVRIVHPTGDPRQDLVLHDFPIIDLNLGSLGYQALVGRDLLRYCKFVMDGPSATFSLEY